MGHHTGHRDKPMGQQVNHALDLVSTMINSAILKLYLLNTSIVCIHVISDLDACVEPILELDEAPNHPHNM